jgi:hypothetical protein
VLTRIILARILAAVLVGPLTLTVSGCDAAGGTLDADMLGTSSPSSRNSLTSIDSALNVLAQQRVYFGHQSFCANILSGLAAVLRDSPGHRLRVVESREPREVVGPALVHFAAGRNEDIPSKNQDFLAVLDARPARDSGIALLKYCYIDVNHATQIDAVFADYVRLVDSVRAKHPDLRLVHMTMPLTTDASGPKASIKRLLGRTTARELNAKRARYNALLRQRYAADGVFDVATLESTRSDGSSESVRVSGVQVRSLVASYTNDGGHLVPDAQRRVAEEFVRFLASVSQ